MRMLQGEAAIVTGAGRGFGRAIAERLAAEGAAVTLAARSRTQVNAVAAAISAGGGRALAAAGDVTERSDVGRIVRAAEDAFGPVTLLVNNAGLAGPFGPIGVLDPDEWWAAQAVHVRGPLLFMSAVLPAMRERRAGRIVNVASRGGREVTPHLSAYGVGKNTEIRLTQHVAAENKAFGIAVFAIEPGTAVTDMLDGTLASPDAQRWVPGMLESLARLKREQPDPAPVFGRCGQMCVDLASGRYDALSGFYLEPNDDFDALLRDATRS
jgi:NAD(P)-dependent dehydrogenase (short-subunit alcohol dehydrogenase family)